jgi:hypothetical protein
MPDPRCTGRVALLVLVAGGLALALAPFDLGALRLAGLSLLWWYVGLLAPAAAAALAAWGLARGGGADRAAAAPDDTRDRRAGA